MGFLDFIKGLVGGDSVERAPDHEWVVCAIAIITDADDDPGAWPQDDGREVLAEWWGIHNADDVQDALARLSDGTDAWDLVRSLHVARMAVSAGYMEHEASLAHSKTVIPRLQQAYANWQELAQAYYVKWQAWAKDNDVAPTSQEEFNQKIGRLHYEMWAATDFRGPV